MNLKDLTAVVSKKTNIEEKIVLKVCKALKDSLVDVMNKGGEVRIRDFGKFSTKETKERFIKNPITKRFVFSRARKQVVFSLFKNFKYCIK